MRSLFALLSFFLAALSARADFPVAQNDPLPVACNVPDVCPCSGKADCTCTPGACQCANCNLSSQAESGYNYTALTDQDVANGWTSDRVTGWCTNRNGQMYHSIYMPVPQFPAGAPPRQIPVPTQVSYAGGCVGGR